MEFQSGTVIKDRRNEERWRVKEQFFKSTQYILWNVEDCAPNMGGRELFMLNLNYEYISPQDRAHDIGDLRESLYKVTEILGGNYTFLPEPVDLVELYNDQDPMSPEQRHLEPGLIFSKGNGVIPKLHGGSLNDQLKNLYSQIIIPCLNTLKVLHRSQVVMRQLPQRSIKLNLATKMPFFLSAMSVIKMDDFVGYNPRKAALRPDPVHSAPECFDPRGRMSPATDIYALGKLICQILMGENYYKNFTPKNPCPADIQNRINALNLPDPWPRFLALCLHPDTNQRFQSAYEAEIFLMPEAKQKEIKKQQEDREKKRSDTRKQSNQTAPKDSNPQGGQTRRAWVYRENRQLPKAALIIWNEDLIKWGKENLDIMAIYQEFLYQYNMSPRLYFEFKPKDIRKQAQGNSADSSDATTVNPYLKSLKDTFGLQTHIYDDRRVAMSTLHHELDAHIKSLKNLILVGHSDSAAVQSLLEHPDRKGWNIHWIRKGAWEPNQKVTKMYELEKFIRARDYHRK